jgi:hypothetical protein
MNPRLKFILAVVAAFAAGGLLVFYFTKTPGKPAAADEGATTSPVQMKRGANGETIISLDAETQKRIGLAVTNLVAMEFLPEVNGFGHVVDTATLAAAVAELETARSTAEVSGKEYERLKSLADGNNVSAKNLETAKADATRDQLAYETARAKFSTAWGKKLSESAADILKSLADGEATLFKIDLPGGTISGSPRGARIVSVSDDEVFKNAEFFDAGQGVDPQTQAQSFVFKAGASQLKPGAAVQAFISIDGAVASGAAVPPEAVLRYQGKTWIYLQTGESDFTRREISDFNSDGGWFARDLSATNRVVIGGAQTVLSAELSSGGFNTGERD